MSTIITEIYDALLEAGASFDSKHNDVQHEFAILEGEFNTVKWMLATNLTLTLLVLGKLFSH